MEKHEELLTALRQIIRTFDLYSKQITRECGLTSSQLILMQTIKRSENLTIRELSHHTNMSQATATSILDRLESRLLVERIRDLKDKRKVHVLLTETGHTLLRQAPQLIPQDFINQFHSLALWEQNLILSSLQHLANMMTVPAPITADAEMPTPTV